MDRKKVRRVTAGESQSHNDTDGVSESEIKRQEKTLKAMVIDVVSLESGWGMPY